MTTTQAVGGSSRSGRTPNNLPAGLIVACSVVLAAAVVVGRGVAPAAVLLIVLSTILAWHRWILAWPVLVCFASSTVLFLPESRYSLALDLPLDLDIWQVGLLLVVLGWLGALLVDPKVQFRRTPLDGSIALIVAASLGSIAVNYGRVAPLASVVLKELIVFVSFIVLYYFISSVVASAARVYLITKFIVCGVGVIALFAIVEQRTGFNVFDHVESVLPLLQFDGSSSPISRYGLIRATGSADHPIALGVLFAMVFPLGLALAKSRSPVWWAPTSLILIGLLVSGSRTPFLALTAGGVALLVLRPRDIRPLLPLAIPMLIVIKLVAPGSIATLKESFLPSSGQGVIESQRDLAADPTLISGRANFKPRLVEGMHRPLLGQGLGTRQTGFNNPLRNAPILDNQWLGTFLDIGLLGVAGFLWMFARIARRLGRVARARASPDGFLAAGFVASLTGFAVAMFTYDSLAFIQEAVMLWVFLALAATLVAVQPRARAVTGPAAGSR